MKAPAAALAVLLLVAICSLAQADLRVSRSAEPLEHRIKGVCCPRTISRPMPHRMIVSAYGTSNTCSTEAVVLVTRNGKKVCADPKARWVQKYWKNFEFIDF